MIPSSKQARTETETRRAVIDLGSNSFRLVIFESGKRGNEHWWRHGDEIYEVVRIGAGEESSGKLSDQAIKRALATLEVFSHYCRSHRIPQKHIHAVATSAIRAAKNQQAFLKRAQKQTGLEIRVLSAEEEAYYDYLAAINSSTLRNGLVLDLGGGSLQLVHIQDRLLKRSASWPLGSVRLTERFLNQPGPATLEEQQRVKKYVHKRLVQHDWITGHPEIIGLGGTVRNLAAAIQQRLKLPTFTVQGFTFTQEDLRLLIDDLAKLPREKRGSVAGIKAARGDIILAGALAIEAVLEASKLQQITVTEFGLREGVFSEQHTKTPSDGDTVRRCTILSLAARHDLDRKHSHHVTKLACSLLTQLQDQGVVNLEKPAQDILWSAAQLHDIGMVIDYDDHHKHSRYIVANSPLAGFTQHEAALIAQVVRYHRKGTPSAGPFSALLDNKEDTKLLTCLATILRLAEDFDRARDQSVDAITVADSGTCTTLTLQATTPVDLATWALQRTSELFSKTFHRELKIKQELQELIQ